MQCVLCGRNNSHIHLNNLCSSCYAANNPLLAQAVPKEPLQIPFCTFCSRLKIGHKWYSLDDSNAIAYLEPELTRILRLSKDVEVIVQQELIDSAEDGTPQTLHLQLQATKKLLQGVVQQEKRVFPIALDAQLCPQCTQIKQAHFEAVLQLRADNRSLDHETVQWISQQVVERTSKAFLKNAKNYISRIEEQANGLDFYFGNASLTIRLARELAACTAAQLKISHKLVSADPSLKHPKKRTTISLRLPSYRRGDFISFKFKLESSEPSEVIQVLAFSRGMVQYYSYKNNTRVSVPVKQFNERNPVVIAPAYRVRPFMIIAQLDDSIQLMDSQTYQIFEIRKPSMETNTAHGKTVNAIVIDGEPYISIYSPENVKI